MFGFIKKLFGATPVETPAEVPYKVEAPASKVEAVNAQPVAEVKPAAPAKKPAAIKAPKKPAAKKPGVAKPKTPRKPKAAKAAK